MRKGLTAIASALSTAIEELLIAAALTLLVVGLWPRFGREALLVPGVILLWLVLPARLPFIDRPVPPSADRKQR